MKRGGLAMLIAGVLMLGASGSTLATDAMGGASGMADHIALGSKPSVAVGSNAVALGRKPGVISGNNVVALGSKPSIIRRDNVVS